MLILPMSGIILHLIQRIKLIHIDSKQGNILCDFDFFYAYVWDLAAELKAIHAFDKDFTRILWDFVVLDQLNL